MRRKLPFAALTFALFLAGFGVASFPALAELRTITITLVGGQEVVTTVDVPPGTPPDQIQLPEISAPIKSITGGARRPPTVRPDKAAQTRPRRDGPSRKDKKQSKPRRASSSTGGEPQPKPEPRKRTQARRHPHPGRRADRRATRP